jgi:hypothetical protein
MRLKVERGKSFMLTGKTLALFSNHSLPAFGSDIASPARPLCERFRKKRGGDGLTDRRRRHRTHP